MVVEKDKIETVIEAFADYIDSISQLDFALTRKGRYLCLQKGLEEEEIESGEWLCAKLLRELELDLLFELRLDNEKLPAEYLPVLRARMQPYMDNLPEYQYLLEQYKL